MNDWNFIKVKQKTAIEIAQNLELSEPAQALLDQTIPPAQFIQKLFEQQLYIDAVLFLAYALPKREATWWACLCAKTGLMDKATAEDLKAIALAEAWVYKPNKENCQRTAQAAEATQFYTAAGWAAIAAFWSGDSIATVNGVNIPPADELTAKAVNAAEALAASIQEADKIDEFHQLFLKQGIDIACGGVGDFAQLEKQQTS